MKRQTIEEYLDGALDAVGRSEVETAVARDAATARAVEQEKSERALRAAVYASYAPSKTEASAFAAQVLAACEDETLQPVGRVGWSWTRKISGIAAAIVVLAGVFVAGRMTASPEVVQQDVAKVMTRVVKIGPGDEIASKEFGPDQTEEMNSFSFGAQNGPSGVATSDLSDAGLLPGHM